MRMRRSLQPVGCARAACALHWGHLVPRPCHPDTRRYTERVRLLCAQPDTKYKSTNLTSTYRLNPIPLQTSLIIQHHNINELFVSVRHSNEFQFQVRIFLKPIAFYRWAWQDNLRKEELEFLFGFLLRCLAHAIRRCLLFPMWDFLPLFWSNYFDTFRVSSNKRLRLVSGIIILELFHLFVSLKKAVLVLLPDDTRIDIILE